MNYSSSEERLHGLDDDEENDNENFPILSFMSPNLRCHRWNCSGEYKEENNVQNVKSPFLVVPKDAFNTLSEEEKARVCSDLYGVDDGVEETESFVSDKLKELEKELNRLPVAVTEGYVLARAEEQKQGSHYIESDKFRLMFLRADRFNAAAAATRMAAFLNEKRELFGIQKLPRRIVQADLNEDDMESLFSGVIYISNHNMESAGRTVVVVRRTRVLFEDIINLKRAVFYYYLASIEENEDAQKRGVVAIVYAIEHIFEARIIQKNIPRCAPQIFKLVSSLPFRIASFHFSSNNFLNNILQSILLRVLAPEERARCISHYGSHTKCRSMMIKYGININNLPIRSNGNYKVELIHSNLKQKEKEEKELQIIL